MITFEMVGQRIQLGRESLKISQKEMAFLLEQKGLKISRETISKIENGSRATNALEIKAIGDIIGIPAEELLHEDEEKDLISLFRSRGEVLTDDTIEELEEVQDFIRSILAQEKIYSDEIKIKRYEPSWR